MVIPMTDAEISGRPPVLPIDVALVHYPVCNKIGETIGSAVTNLDLHDIARACKTFGVDTFYVVTPFAEQQRLTREILDHWLSGHGALANPKRKEALSLVRISENLSSLFEAVREKRGKRATVLTTCARQQDDMVTVEQTRKALWDGDPMLLLFGTAWGLAPEVYEQADAGLPPICGVNSTYNHLSVRSAVSIMLDRLLGQR